VMLFLSAAHQYCRQNDLQKAWQTNKRLAQIAIVGRYYWLGWFVSFPTGSCATDKSGFPNNVYLWTRFKACAIEQQLVLPSNNLRQLDVARSNRFNFIIGSAHVFVPCLFKRKRPSDSRW